MHGTIAWPGVSTDKAVTFAVQTPRQLSSVPSAYPQHLFGSPVASPVFSSKIAASDFVVNSVGAKPTLTRTFLWTYVTRVSGSG